VLSSAVAGLGQACWDIGRKARGTPVHELLGGPVRDSVRVYCWVCGDDPSGLVDAVQEQVDAGFTAVKMNASGPIAAPSSPQCGDLHDQARPAISHHRLSGGTA